MIRVAITLENIAHAMNASPTTLRNELRDRGVNPNVFVWATTQSMERALDMQMLGQSDEIITLRSYAQKMLEELTNPKSAVAQRIGMQTRELSGRICPACGDRVLDHGWYSNSSRTGNAYHRFSCANCGTQWRTPLEHTKTITQYGSDVPERDPENVSEAVTNMLDWAHDDLPDKGYDEIVETIERFAQDILSTDGDRTDA